MELRLEHIYKSYAHPVLEDFSHTFAGGSRTALMGASGCGKTTLLHIAAGLIRPERGQVTGIDGVKRSIVFQEDRLIPQLTTLENLLAVGGVRSEALDILEDLQLNREADFRPSALSGGMRRRVALARALLYRGDIFFLDEPFKGLDANIKNAAIDAVNRRTAGKTIIVVTHDEDEAKKIADCRLEL